MVPRIFGPYEPIRRDYPIEEYLADIAGTGVVKSVYVQANWAPDRAEDEVAYVQEAADETGWPHAIVAYANLIEDDVRPALDRLKKHPLVRGIRMQLHWHDERAVPLRQAPRPRRRRDVSQEFRGARRLRLLLRSAGFRRSDGWAPRGSPPIFRRRHSSCSMPACSKIFRRQGRAAWRTGMQVLAAQPNVVSKLSALGTFIHRNDPEHIAWVVRETVALFGADRCLFGSNFPIEKLWTGYRPLIEAYRAALAGYPEAEQHARAMLHDNLRREDVTSDKA